MKEYKKQMLKLEKMKKKLTQKIELIEDPQKNFTDSNKLKALHTLIGYLHTNENDLEHEIKILLDIANDYQKKLDGGL